MSADALQISSAWLYVRTNMCTATQKYTRLGVVDRSLFLFHALQFLVFVYLVVFEEWGDCGLEFPWRDVIKSEDQKSLLVAYLGFVGFLDNGKHFRNIFLTQLWHQLVEHHLQVGERNKTICIDVDVVEDFL